MAKCEMLNTPVALYVRTMPVAESAYTQPTMMPSRATWT